MRGFERGRDVKQRAWGMFWTSDGILQSGGLVCYNVQAEHFFLSTDQGLTHAPFGNFEKMCALNRVFPSSERISYEEKNLIAELTNC